MNREQHEDGRDAAEKAFNALKNYSLMRVLAPDRVRIETRIKPSA